MRNEATIGGGNLIAELARSMTEEYKDIVSSVDKAANQMSRELLRQVKQDALVKTGRYRDGFIRKRKRHNFYVTNTYPNRIIYIQRGHMIKKGPNTGRMTKSYPGTFDTPAEAAQERFKEVCRKIVEEGLRL